MGRSRFAAAGFTLIEILVVVAIIAVIAAAALLSVDLAGGERAVESEARRLLELTRLACERAATTGRDYGLQVGGDRYAFSRVQGAAWRVEPEGELRERVLPDGLRLELERVGHAVDTDDEHAREQPAVVCAANGELTPFHARIAAREGFAYEVRGEIDGALTIERAPAPP
jgi:general secretion pathway protein H